ncbi:MAG TPA: lmo0937 family membrane protein [Steroidobacteraceae bacterium]|nr:lmo0937 family membrane protein [Steroidobacteraceae bacterium]
MGTQGHRLLVQLGRRTCLEPVCESGPGELDFLSNTAIRGSKVLWTIAVILFVLWVLGLVSSYTMGGFIHVLLVLAVVVILVNVIQGRRVL